MSRFSVSALFSRKLVAGAILALALPAAGHAATIGMSLSIGGSKDAPSFTLSNTGTVGVLTSFVMSIGNAAYNFDAGYGASPSGFSSATLGSSLDSDTHGGLRSDELSWSFDGFSSGNSFAFLSELDQDGRGETKAKFWKVLFPKGTALATFQVGDTTQTIEITFGKQKKSKLYSFSASQDVEDSPVAFSALASRVAIDPPAPVPLPASGLLLVAGLGGLALRRRAKR